MSMVSFLTLRNHIIILFLTTIKSQYNHAFIPSLSKYFSCNITRLNRNNTSNIRRGQQSRIEENESKINRSKKSKSDENKENTILERIYKNKTIFRGDTYGIENNSTIPTPTEVAVKLNVRPPKIKATSKTWKRAWKLHTTLLPLLHSLDSCKPPDSSLNIACMWWKAMSGNDVSSPVFDDGLAYDLLPSGFRYIVSKRMLRFYPRLHHANVEMRTAFLDKSIHKVISETRASWCNPQKELKFRLICFGAGYDLRSIKFLQSQLIQEAFELDLPQVVQGKQRLIGSDRLLKRRPTLNALDMPKLIPADLNDIDSVRSILSDILSYRSNTHDYHTIFVFEGVMIYLKEGIPGALLNVISSTLKNCDCSTASLCFADRLDNIPGGDIDAAKMEMTKNGWTLSEWCPKPGLARHMGSAHLRDDGMLNKIFSDVELNKEIKL